MDESKQVEAKPKMFRVKSVSVEVVYDDEPSGDEKKASFLMQNVDTLTISQQRDIQAVNGGILVGKDNIFSLTVNYQR